MTTNKPVHQIKEGRVRAAIWANEGKDGVRHTVTLERFYKQGESIKSASSFYLDDIERLEKVLSQAKSWLTEQATAAEAPVAEEVA
jgi:hypothetical protein